jgi:hypothetical protein
MNLLKGTGSRDLVNKTGILQASAQKLFDGRATPSPPLVLISSRVTRFWIMLILL